MLMLTMRVMLTNSRKAEKLQERFGGIRNMNRVPDLLFVVDVNREETAVREANILGIPVVDHIVIGGESFVAISHLAPESLRAS